MAQKLRENWARLTPYGRALMLVTAVNFELSHVDVPSATFELSDKLAPQTGGEFVANEKDWAFQLNRAMFSDPSPDAIDQESEGSPGLAQIVYHEAARRAAVPDRAPEGRHEVEGQRHRRLALDAG